MGETETNNNKYDCSQIMTVAPGSSATVDIHVCVLDGRGIDTGLRKYLLFSVPCLNVSGFHADCHRFNSHRQTRLNSTA